MSYSLLVQSEKPLGYWRFNGSNLDSTNNLNNATVASGLYVSPALVANNSSAYFISGASGGSVTITNQYDAFFKNYESKDFSIEFWFSFNGNFSGNGYPSSLSSASQYFSSNILNIISIMSGATQVGSINYDYSKNTFRFTISGAGNTDAYIPVRNLDTNFYIVASYSDGKTNISVNGDSGLPGTIINTINFPTKGSSNYFQINANSISQSTFGFLISDLAFYNYELSKEQKRRRVVAAYNDDKPILMSGIIESSMFDFKESAYHNIYHQHITGNDFLTNKIYDNNLIIHENDGLKAVQVPSFTLSDQNPTSSVTISSTSGVQMSNASTALQLDKFGEFFVSEPYITITAQVSLVSNASGVVFSIPEVINNQITLYAVAASNGLYINSYDPNTVSTSSILYAAATPSTASTYNLGISFSNLNFYISASGATQGTASISNPGVTISAGNSLFLGNIPTSPSANTMYIKNFGINNLYQTTFSGYDFTDNKMFMARLTNDLSVSQIGNYVMNVPLSHFGNVLQGSRVSWTSMDNCIVQVSRTGSTWTNINNGEPIPLLSANNLNNDVLLKVIVPFEYQVETNNQSFYDLNISLYKDLSFLSKDGNYYLQPASDSSSSQPYTVKELNYPINQRLNKFGLSFNKNSSNFVPGYCVVVPTSSAYQPTAADFWIKLYSLPTASGFILDGDPTGLRPRLYINANKFIYSSSATPTLYVNGSAVTSNTFSPSVGFLYHLFFDFGGSVSQSASIYINGQQPATASTHNHSSYGNLNIWNTLVSASTALIRYQHYTGNQINSYNSWSIAVESGSPLWQPNWNTTGIASASGYKIG